MEKFVIDGGKPLIGNINTSGMKNSALPIIYATILAADKCRLENIPDISDVAISFEILKGMGARVTYLDKTTVEVDTTDVIGSSSDPCLVC